MKTKPLKEEIVELVVDYYVRLGNSAGGNLHVVIDDGNIDDDFVQHALERAKKEKDKEAIYIAELLLQVPESERESLYDRWSQAVYRAMP